MYAESNVISSGNDLLQVSLNSLCFSVLSTKSPLVQCYVVLNDLHEIADDHLSNVIKTANNRLPR